MYWYIIYIYIMYIYIYLTACFYVLLLTTTQTGCANTLGINGPQKTRRREALLILKARADEKVRIRSTGAGLLP